MTQFDLQDFLTDMRRELNGKLDRQEDRLELLDHRVQAHETRLTVMEKSARMLQWFFVTAIGGGILEIMHIVAPRLFGTKP